MDNDGPEPLFGLTHKGVSDVDLVERMKSLRTLSQAEVDKRAEERHCIDFSAADLYEAHSGHDEYGVAHH